MAPPGSWPKRLHERRHARSSRVRKPCSLPGTGSNPDIHGGASVARRPELPVCIPNGYCHVASKRHHHGVERQRRTPMFDQFKQQLPDIDPVETQEWMESLESVVQHAGTKRAQYLMYKLLKAARVRNIGLPPTTQDAVHQHDQSRARADVPGRRDDGATYSTAHPLERRRHGHPRESSLRWSRGASLDVRVGGDAARGGFQSFLPGARIIPEVETRSTSRVMRRPASMRARFSKDGSASSSSIATGGRRAGGEVCRAIRTRA